MQQNRSKLMTGFLVPSIIGIILFMIPVKYDGAWTILVKIIADKIGGLVGPVLPLLCVIIITISAVLALIGLAKPKFMTDNKILADNFVISPVWTIIRVLGCIFVWIAYLAIGADTDSLLGYISSGDNGGFVLGDLLTTLVIIFVIAAFLLPLLLDFGLLEYVGARLTRFMRPIFRIPGRAAVDCITSWIGDGTLGVMLTLNQYEQGYYSMREAAVVATTFSAVSITFCLVVLEEVGLGSAFVPYYLTVCLIGVVCAIIVPRIPPLSLKKDTYLVEGNAMPDTVPAEYRNSHEYGLDLALKRVAAHKGVGEFFENGLKNAVGMWFGVMPSVMAIGTIALILANNTPIFDYLGMPFRPLLQLLQVPEAAAASKTIIVGFTDMFAPAIIAAGTIQNPATLFIIAVFSVTQLIYLSEVGGLILASKLPVNILELFIIFIERTIISLVIACPIAYMLF